MTIYLRVFAVAIATFVLSIRANAHTDNTRSEIAQKEAYWTSALAAGDIDTLVAMYEDQAWLIVPGAEPFRGRDAIRAALAGLKSNTRWMNLKTASIEKIANDYVIENGIAETLSSGAGASIQHDNYQVLWHRMRNGNWKIVRDTVTPLSIEKYKTCAPIAVVNPGSINAGMCTPGIW